MYPFVVTVVLCRLYNRGPPREKCFLTTKVEVENEYRLPVTSCSRMLQAAIQGPRYQPFTNRYVWNWHWTYTT